MIQRDNIELSFFQLFSGSRLFSDQLEQKKTNFIKKNTINLKKSKKNLGTDESDIFSMSWFHGERVALERARGGFVLDSDQMRDSSQVRGEVDSALDFSIHQICVRVGKNQI